MLIDNIDKTPQYNYKSYGQLRSMLQNINIYNSENLTQQSLFFTNLYILTYNIIRHLKHALISLEKKTRLKPCLKHVTNRM